MSTPLVPRAKYPCPPSAKLNTTFTHSTVGVLLCAGTTSERVKFYANELPPCGRHVYVRFDRQTSISNIDCFVSLTGAPTEVVRLEYSSYYNIRRVVTTDNGASYYESHQYEQIVRDFFAPALEHILRKQEFPEKIRGGYNFRRAFERDTNRKGLTNLSLKAMLYYAGVKPGLSFTILIGVGTRSVVTHCQRDLGTGR